MINDTAGSRRAALLQFAACAMAISAVALLVYHLQHPPMTPEQIMAASLAQ